SRTRSTGAFTERSRGRSRATSRRAGATPERGAPRLALAPGPRRGRRRARRPGGVEPGRDVAVDRPAPTEERAGRARPRARDPRDASARHRPARRLPHRAGGRLRADPGQDADGSGGGAPRWRARRLRTRAAAVPGRVSVGAVPRSWPAPVALPPRATGSLGPRRRHPPRRYRPPRARATGVTG